MVAQSLHRAAEVQYVSPQGSDSDSGRELRSAKLTIYAAIQALGTAGGTVYVQDQAAIGGPVFQQGIWLLGSGDPNYASPPTGWLRSPASLRIVGLSGSNNGGNSPGPPNSQITGHSSTDNTKPAIWISGVGNGQALLFERIGIKFAAQSTRIGIASDNSTRDVVTARIVFRDCGLGINQVSGNNLPNVDIGYVFWLKFDCCDINGNYTQATTSDARAAIRIMPQATTGRSAGLIDIRDTNLAGGGIIYECGTSAWSLNVENVLMEAGGSSGPNPLPWTVRIRNAVSYGHAKLSRVAFADASTIDGYNIRIEPSTTQSPADASNVTAEMVDRIYGPATVISNDFDPAVDIVNSPASMRQRGFWAGQRITGQHDGSRRQHGLTTVKTANLAPHDSTTWSGKVGSGTVTANVTDPTGGTNAGKIASGGKQIYRATRTFATGDFIVAGIWARMTGLGTSSNVNLGQGAGVLGRISFNPATVTINPAFSASQSLQFPGGGDGEWEWLWAMVEISTGGSVELIFDLYSPAGGIDYYAPLLLHIATGTMSRNEVSELAVHAESWTDFSGPSVGTLASRRNQPVWFGGAIQAVDSGGTTRSLIIGAGSVATASRPSSPVTGQDHWNTTIAAPEWWNGNVWVNPQHYIGRPLPAWWVPVPGTGAGSLVGYQTPTVSGASARFFSTTSYYSRQPRVGYASTSSAGTFGSTRVAATGVTTGSGGGSPVGGFLKICRFGIGDSALVAGARMFVGVSSSTGAPSNVEPSTLTNSIGVGHGASDTNLMVYFGAGSAGTPVDLGANFPTNTQATDLYELWLLCPPSGGAQWKVTRLNTGHTAVGSLTSGQIPGSGTGLTYMQAWRTNNATASIVILDLFGDYIDPNIAS